MLLNTGPQVRYSEGFFYIKTTLLNYIVQNSG